MLDWISQNKEWIFQGIGAIAVINVASYLLPWIARLGRAVRRTTAAGGARIRTLLVSSGERASTLPWVGLVVMGLLLVLVATIAPQMYRGVRSVSEGALETVTAPSLRLVDRGGLPLALTWVSVMRHGVVVCEGRTTSTGELSCAALAGKYLITSQIRGLPVALDVEIRDGSTSVSLPFSLGGM